MAFLLLLSAPFTMHGENIPSASGEGEPQCISGKIPECLPSRRFDAKFKATFRNSEFHQVNSERRLSHRGRATAEETRKMGGKGHNALLPISFPYSFPAQNRAFYVLPL